MNPVSILTKRDIQATLQNEGEYSTYILEEAHYVMEHARDRALPFHIDATIEIEGQSHYHIQLIDTLATEAGLINHIKAKEKVATDWPEVRHIEIGDWQCPDPHRSPFSLKDEPSVNSPIGVCAYDHDQDPMHDECLYCGYPEERK